jgi:hypothetical protein
LSLALNDDGRFGCPARKSRLHSCLKVLEFFECEDLGPGHRLSLVEAGELVINLQVARVEYDRAVAKVEPTTQPSLVTRGPHATHKLPKSTLDSAGQGVPVQREMERGRSPLMSIPPLRGGDFQGIRVYRSDMVLGRARKANFRAQQHRLDEPTKLSLGMVASLQSPLPFHLARSL